VAFLVVLGLPIAWYALRALARGESVAIALFAVLAISALLGFTKAETERIYLFLVPLACIAAAPALPERFLTPTLAARRPGLHGRDVARHGLVSVVAAAGRERAERVLSALASSRTAAA